MYNSSKAIIFGGFFVILIFFFGTIRFLPNISLRRNDNVPTYLVSYKNRIWWISQKGEFLHIASSTDILKKAIVSGIEVKELSVSKDSLEIITMLKDVLNSPYVAEVKLNQKCAILLKGVILYLSDWKDLINHLSRLKDLIVVMQPKTEYFLTSAGLVYKIRGGGGEEE